jgi:peptidoglycan/xylan/chitin deacetylase (PgdA/CDA1 family)
MQRILIAMKGKGQKTFFRRVGSILERYGITAHRYDQALSQLIQTLARYDCRGTFPITAAVLQRHARQIRQHQEQGTEFAVHGYYHVDHSELDLGKQREFLARSKRITGKHGIRITGFRCPYLRWNQDTLTALQEEGYLYDSSQGLAWPVPAEIETAAYRHVLSFYRAKSASEQPSLPSLENGLVRIPYSLPDDEALVERLALHSAEQKIELWLDILRRTYELGELFTIGLHPERFFPCREPLEATLREARSLSPVVWVARLDEIARWWRARFDAKIEIEQASQAIHISVSGPPGITALARGVEVDVPAEDWIFGYRRLSASTFAVSCSGRPFIGVSPASPSGLAGFLKQLGYIVEISSEDRGYSHYFDWQIFEDGQQRLLLEQIERSDKPLVRLAAWPDGARSALAVSGDIDALTLVDYGLRMFEK